MADNKEYIYSPTGDALHEVTLTQNCKRKFSLMNEDSVTLVFSLDNPLSFPVGSRFHDFYITKAQNGSYNATTGVYDYSLKFNAYYWQWANKVLKYATDTANAPAETSFSLTATIDIHASVITKALTKLGYKFEGSPFGVNTSDTSLSSEAKLIRYENTSILGGIQAIAEAFECEWWVVGNIIYFGKLEHKNTHFEFEAGVNVSSISFSDSKESAPNRLYVFGSDRNLPANYREMDSADTIGGIVNKRLMLPQGTPYLQTKPNIPEAEIVEKVIILDDVYPRMTLSVNGTPESYTSDAENEDGTITTQTYYRIKTNDDFIFSYAYILPNEELKIRFTSGLLNGMEFGARFNPKGLSEKFTDEETSETTLNPDAQLYEIVANEDYGRVLPDTILKPQSGDSFILIGWDSTKIADLGLVAAAESELLAEGNKVLNEYTKDLSSCTCPMAWDYMKPLLAANKQPKPGDAVIVKDSIHFGEGGRTSRIIGYEYSLDIPYADMVYTVGENVSVSRLKNIESKLEGLAKSGETAYIQNSLDFLSKRRSDRTPYRLTSDTSFDVADFLAGVSGARLGVDKESGKTFLEVDNIIARVKAYFEQLTIINADTVAGRQYITPGGSVRCTMVEETDTAYRCYFLSEQDGEKTETYIKVGDQAISEMFNATEGTENKVSNHRWWRLVTDVQQSAYIDDSGNVYGYIEVSKSDCEAKSDIPQEDDVICQLGSRNDTTRQAAMIFDTVGSNAPSVTLLTAIGSGTTNAEHYSLAKKDIISYGYDKTKGHAYCNVYGDTYIGDRGGVDEDGNPTEGESYIRYDQDTKELDIKARLSVKSTIGDGKDSKTILEYIRDGGRKVFTETPVPPYSEGDIWLNAAYTDEEGNVVFDGDIVYCTAPKKGEYTETDEDGNEVIVPAEEFDAADWAKADKYSEKIAVYKYLKDALAQTTDIDGGVILSSYLALGYTDSNDIRHTLAGMNGIWNPDLSGRTVASWWGGENIDLFNPDGTIKTGAAAQNAAASLVRMDGSAYWGKGLFGFESDGSGWFGEGDNKITFKDGAMTFGSGITINVKDEQGIQQTLQSVLNQMLTFGNALTPMYKDANGKYQATTWGAIAKGSANGGHDLAAIKTGVGFYSEKFISALGASETEAPVGVTMLSALNDVALTALAPGQILEWNGSKWVNVSKPSAGLDTAALDAHLATKGYITSADLSSYLLSDTASQTYLTKTDAQTLYQPVGTYLTDHQDIYALTLQAGVFSALTYDPKTGAQTVSIPTSSDHLTEGTANLFFTDQRAKNALKSTTDALALLISGNQTAIAGNATDIASLTAALADETSDRQTEDGKLLARIKDLEDMFEWDSDGNIRAKAGLWTYEFLSAKGKSDSQSSGLNEMGLQNYLDNHGYATLADTQAWVSGEIAKINIPSVNLDDYAKTDDIQAWVGQQGFALAKDIPVIPDTLKNPHALTIQKNGTTLDTYDGSAATTVDIVIEWTDIQNPPSTFTPSKHSHPTSEIDTLDDTLTGIRTNINDNAVLIAANASSISSLTTALADEASARKQADIDLAANLKTLSDWIHGLFEIKDGHVHVLNDRGLWSDAFISAKGKSDNTSAGIDKTWLDANGYVTQSWIGQQGFLTASDLPNLSGYALASDLTAHTSDTAVHVTSDERTKWNNVASIMETDTDNMLNKWGEIVDFLNNSGAGTLGEMLSHKADKTRKISTTSGQLTGGGDLSADITLSLATSGVTAGTYTKLTVDVYGRATSGGSLVATDIPDISATYLTVAEFARYFKMVTENGVESIQAMKGLWTQEFISAKGKSDSTGGGIDASWLSDNGYATLAATQSWVNQQSYLTSSSLAAYVTLDTAQSITGAKVFGSHVSLTGLAENSATPRFIVSDENGKLYFMKNADMVSHIGALSSAAITDMATMTWVGQNFNNYSLPTASATVLGGVKIGSQLSIDANGVLSATYTYTHPTATATTLTDANGKVISAITVDALGHVTSVAQKSLVAADIPNLDWSKIATGKPDTLAGYGIGDAYTKTEISSQLSAYLPLGGGTMSGWLRFAAISGTAYPVDSMGIGWSGGTDFANIFYRLTANDKGKLILNMQDDADTEINFMWSGGSFNGGTPLTPYQFLYNKLIATEVAAEFKSVKIGSATLEWDSVNQGIKVSHGLYSQSYISAKGASSATGGGNSYNRLDSWSAYSSDKSGYVLSAGLGYDLHTRLSSAQNSITTLYGTTSSLSTSVDTLGVDLTALDTRVTTLEGSSANLSNYLPLSGGTLTGAVLMGSNVASASASQPTALSYGRLQAYGTLSINANTDNSGTEYVILTAGHGLSSSTADGLAIGTDTLTWKNTAISLDGHTHNYLSVIPGSFDFNAYNGYFVGLTRDHGLGDSWRHVLSMNWPTASTTAGDMHWLSQLLLPSKDNNSIYYRKGLNATNISDWIMVLDASNYASVLNSVYQPKGSYAKFERTDTNPNNFTQLGVIEVESSTNSPTSNIWNQYLSWGTGDSRYAFQFANEYNNEGSVYFRQKVGNEWKSWKTLLDSSNYTSYVYTKSQIDTALDTLVTIGTTQTINGAKTFNTSSNTCPLVISRAGAIYESVSLGVDDSDFRINYQNDEDYSYVRLRMQNTDAEAGTGHTSDNTLSIRSDINGMRLDLPGSISTRYINCSVSSGTAPLSVNSTTVCPNLNADLLDGIHSTGFMQSNSVAAGTDLNTLTQSGVYRINLNSVHQPDAEFNHGQVLTLHGYGDTIAQMAFSYSNSGKVAVRAGNPIGHSDDQWGAWQYLATLSNLSSYLLKTGKAADSDMLDGLHADSFPQINTGFRCDKDSIYDLRFNVGVYNRNDRSSGQYYSEYPSPYGAFISLAYNNKNTAALIFIDSGYSGGGSHMCINTRLAGDNNTQYTGWKTVAYLTDNVASASKLQTTRSIWGQSFDGSGNVNGLITTTVGSSHSGIKIGDTYLTAIDGRIIFQNNSEIRFGGDAWNWDVWAGLKYDSTNKIIYLGLADKNNFQANSAQSGGTVILPGITSLKVGSTAVSLDGHSHSQYLTSLPTHSHDYLNSNGPLTAVSDTTTGASGLRMYEVYSNGYPTTYGNLIRVVGGTHSGHGELLLGWTADTSTGRLFYRSKRDVASTSWSAWSTVAYLTDINKTNIEAALTGNITTHTHSQYLTSHQSLAAYATTAAMNAALDTLVTISTSQTITGAKTFKDLHVKDIPNDKSMPHFLGINSFADGGVVKWIAKEDVCSDIGALPIAGGTITGPLTVNTSITCLGDMLGDTITSNGGVTAGGVIDGCTRIYNAVNENIYIGNSNNSGYIYVQDIASHSGVDKWVMDVNGGLKCKTVNAATRLSVGVNLSQQTTNRAELSVISVSDTPADLMLGANNAKRWALTTRHSTESYAFGLWHYGSSAWAVYINASRQVGINTSSPSYTFHVSGTAYASTGIFSDGYVSAKGQSTSSDVRLKNIIGSVNLDIRDIATLPAVRFNWKDTGARAVGTIAQNVQKLLPETVRTGHDGFLTLDYGTAAMLMVIETAKRTVSHEERIRRLEKALKEHGIAVPE